MRLIDAGATINADDGFGSRDNDVAGAPLIIRGLFPPPPKSPCPIHRGFIAMSGSTNPARPGQMGCQ